MPIPTNTIHADDLREQITLYRHADYIDIIRNIPKKHLEIVGHFKAAVAENNFTTPDDIIAKISHIKQVFLRVSALYRSDFIKNNYIRYRGQLMRIASSSYDRKTGITACMCYDISEV